MILVDEYCKEGASAWLGRSLTQDCTHSYFLLQDDKNAIPYERVRFVPCGTTRVCLLHNPWGDCNFITSWM